jgi:hypothetical protein
MTIDLTFWLITALILSLAANGFAFWYIGKLLKKFLFISENLSDLVQIITTFRNHIKSIYSLEMYYGDETMQNLISHTVSLVELLEEYEDIYSITEPLSIGEEEEINNEENLDGSTENQEEKDVFYAGSRKRDS